MKSMILAVDRNGGIGYKGGLPWPRIAEDMAWFRHITMQHKRCIMGRRTFKSIGRLKGRECHVVTSSQALAYEIPAHGHTTPPPLEDGDIVIGGATLYEFYADQVDVVFLTEVNGVHDSDVKIDLELILKDKWLHRYGAINDGHFINVYAGIRDLDNYSSDTGKHAKEAVDMLDIHFRAAFPRQPAVPAQEPVQSVYNPAHYTQGGIETIDAVGAVTTGYTGEDAFCAGNVVKYISRAPFKGNRAEDLQKSLWYLKRLIASGGGDDC